LLRGGSYKETRDKLWKKILARNENLRKLKSKRSQEKKGKDSGRKKKEIRASLRGLKKEGEHKRA